MSERKVLNKYYPPDFDPAKIPRAKANRNRQFTVRLMAPCNMKCFTCGEYIAKAKKFNARKEDVEDQNYLGIRIYRFYIKCPGCLAEISFRTDPESTDYIIEAGAHRNFQALKLAEEQAAREAREEKEEIESNPMLLLENRTQQSQHEMEVLESLEDLREMSERHAKLDLNSMTNKYQQTTKLSAEQQEEADKLEALTALGYEMIEGKLIKRLNNEEEQSESKRIKTDDHSLPSDVLIDTSEKKVNLKSKFSGLVKRRCEKPPVIKGEVLDPDPESSSSSSIVSVISSSTSLTKATNSSNNQNVNQTTSALSLLSSYSDSESSSNDET